MFWFLTKLSKEYDSTISYPLTYENLPKDKLLQETPQDKVDIHIKATGFKILSGKLFPKTLKVDASNLISKSANDFYLLLPRQKSSIQKQMNTGVTIDHFIKDSINFNLGFLGTKKVPVQLVSDITYQTGYNIDGEIRIQPDSVLIAGPESILDTIQSVLTNNLVKRDLDTSIDEELGLRKFESSLNVNLDVEKVKIDAIVEKFTEGTQTIAFTIVNPPEGVKINTFQKKWRSPIK